MSKNNMRSGYTSEYTKENGWDDFHYIMHIGDERLEYWATIHLIDDEQGDNYYCEEEELMLYVKSKALGYEIESSVDCEAPEFELEGIYDKHIINNPEIEKAILKQLLKN